mgnify:CR=1 FL=1|nr:MAG TPA: Clr5 domain protein [Caudoviricetes sp.]
MLKNNLKAIITKQGFTLSQINSELNRRHNTDFSVQNFSNRMRRESFLYTEIEEILDIINYHIEWHENS